MSNRRKASQETQKLTGTAILAAIIVVLTVFCTFIKFGPFSITLALAPIIIGGAVYGAATGALLGGVFGLIVLLTGILGWDGGTVMYLMSMSAIGTVLICLVKGAAAGWLASLVCRAIGKKSTLAGVICGGIVCPVVNTGLFVLGMMVFFMDTLSGWAGGQNLLAYVVLGLCGVNFLVELAVNLLLSAAITRILKVVKK